MPVPKLIQDEFTDRPISRQRRYQLRRQAEGCCKICHKPLGPKGECSDHRPRGLRPSPGQPRAWHPFV